MTKHSGGFGEGIGGEEIDVGEMGSGLPGGLVGSEFWKDDFHEIIIAYLGESVMM